LEMTMRYIAYEFLLAFHNDYAPVLYHFLDKARYWSKIAVFSYPACPLDTRGFPFEYCHNAWKTSVVWLYPK